MKKITVVVAVALLLVQVVNTFPHVKRESVEVAVNGDSIKDSSSKDDHVKRESVEVVVNGDSIKDSSSKDDHVKRDSVEVADNGDSIKDSSSMEDHVKRESVEVAVNGDSIKDSSSKEDHVKRDSVEVADNGDNTVDSSSEEDQASSEILIYVVGAIGKLSKWMLENGSVLIKNTVKDLEKLPNKDQLLQANITRMSKIAKEASDFKLQEDGENILQLFENIGSFSEVLSDYESMPDDSDLKLTLKTALENNGYEKFQNELEEHIVNLVEEFDVLFGEYVKGLSPDEKIEQANLLNWYEELTNETDENEKIDKFSEIFDLL
nr:uncharacterized protein LOC118681446 [Bactrocera oleae]